MHEKGSEYPRNTTRDGERPDPPVTKTRLRRGAIRRDRRAARRCAGIPEVPAAGEGEIMDILCDLAVDPQELEVPPRAALDANEA